MLVLANPLLAIGAMVVPFTDTDVAKNLDGIMSVTEYTAFVLVVGTLLNASVKLAVGV